MFLGSKKRAGGKVGDGNEETKRAQTDRNDSSSETVLLIQLLMQQQELMIRLATEQELTKVRLAAEQEERKLFRSVILSLMARTGSSGEPTTTAKQEPPPAATSATVSPPGQQEPPPEQNELPSAKQ